MTILCEAVERDWSGAQNGHASSTVDGANHLKESVHAALGQLIKQRKVYYTGKGYFLVTPTEGAVSTSPLKGLGTRYVPTITSNRFSF